MSAYGVQLFNNYNLTVATADDVNYTLVSSGQVSDWEFRAAGRVRSLLIDVNGLNAPLLFLQMGNADARLCQKPAWSTSETAGSGRYIGEKFIELFKWHNKNIGTVQYYLFDRWIPPERSTYGLQIFDGGGSIIFDGGWNFLKLRDVIWMNPGFPNHASNINGANWTQVGNVGNANNIALSMPWAREWIVSDGIYSYRTNECCHYDGSGNLFSSILLTGEYLDLFPQNGWIHQMKSQIMVADVTGLPTSYNPRRKV